MSVTSPISVIHTQVDLATLYTPRVCELNYTRDPRTFGLGTAFKSPHKAEMLCLVSFSLERNFLFPNVIYSENGFWFSFCTGCPVLQSIYSHFISPTFSFPLILRIWGIDTHFERNHLPYWKNIKLFHFCKN